MSNDWLRFHWDVEALPQDERGALPPFVFRRAEAGDAETILRVVSSALMMERAWNGADSVLGKNLEKHCREALDSAAPAAAVVQHGSRIIGASVLQMTDGGDFHLLTGPCILHEYRSRGLGSALLYDSLALLRKEGLKIVSGMARVNSTASRFVYPKFGGTAEPVTTPRLAA